MESLPFIYTCELLNNLIHSSMLVSLLNLPWEFTLDTTVISPSSGTSPYKNFKSYLKPNNSRTSPAVNFYTVAL